MNVLLKTHGQRLKLIAGPCFTIQWDGIKHSSIINLTAHISFIYLFFQLLPCLYVIQINKKTTSQMTKMFSDNSCFHKCWVALNWIFASTDVCIHHVHQSNTKATFPFYQYDNHVLYITINEFAVKDHISRCKFRQFKCEFRYAGWWTIYQTSVMQTVQRSKL